MQAACSAGDYADALRMQQQLMPLHEALFAEPSPAGAKYACSLLGLCEATCRLPIVPLSDAGRQGVKAAMACAGLL